MRTFAEQRAWMIGRKGNKSNAWKGDDAGYVAIHQWLTNNYSKGKTCEDCGCEPKTRLEWANISGEYRRERSDYRILCPPCHRTMDLKSSHCRNGHERTEDNTANYSSRTICLVCTRIANKKHKEKKRNE